MKETEETTLEIPVEEIQGAAQKRAEKISSFCKIRENEDMFETMKEQYKEFLSCFYKTTKNLCIKASIIRCVPSHSVIQNTLESLLQGCIIMESQAERISEGVFYVITVEEREERDRRNGKSTILEELYKDMIITAYLDCGREWIRIHEQVSEKSIAVGPGFYGLPLSQTQEYYHLCRGESLGVAVLENGTLVPKGTCTGGFLISEQEIVLEKACITCKGEKKNCMFCTLWNGI